MGHCLNTADGKVCPVCGRSFGRRKKWEGSWHQVRYCSRSCRSRGLRPLDHLLEKEILRLLDERGAGRSICPSEAARRVKPNRTDWRELMEPTRMAARRLCHSGRLEILQRGRVVDPDRARGPIRLRKPVR